MTTFTTTIELPEFVTVDIGKGLTMDVSLKSLLAAPDSTVVLLKRALKDRLQDSHASITAEVEPDTKKRQDQSRETAQKVLDALYRNEARVRSSAPRVSSIDPVEAEALKIARVDIYGKARGWEKGNVESIAYLTALIQALATRGVDVTASGKKDDGSFFYTPEDYKKFLGEAIKLRAAREDVRATAKATVEAKAKLSVDVSDLL